MSRSSRGRALSAVFVLLLLVAGGIGAAAVIGARGSASPNGSGGAAGGGDGSGGSPPPSPPEFCPLSGLKPAGGVPVRPALAIKVENLPSARPQTGLTWADLVFEEPVEGGITRFVAVYQCQDASRIEPIRSARLTDADIVSQLGHPLFAYAGGVPAVEQAVRHAGAIDVNYDLPRVAKAYHRDPNRLAPHNLYTSTRDLYEAAGALYQPIPPRPLFTYSAGTPSGGRSVSQVHVPFSYASDVYWKWSASKGRWLRFYGSQPATASDGTQFSATNVVVQLVTVKMTDVVDTNGVHSPQAVTIGSGKAYVLRDGRLIAGTWQRSSARDAAKFVDAHGNEISLAPGNTWIELLPKTLAITAG